jgi:glucose-6-phosphate isomerase
MISVINIKTKEPYEFTEEQWEIAKMKGLHKKYKITEQTEEINREEARHFSPPELKKPEFAEVKEVVKAVEENKPFEPEVKKEVKPKGKKNKTVG